ASGGNYDLDMLVTERRKSEQRLVLPGEQHIANVSLDERVRRAARTAVEHRCRGIDPSDELAGCRLRGGDLFSRSRIVQLGPIAAKLAVEHRTPCGQVIPARSARGLRVRCDDLDDRSPQIGPGANVLRLAGPAREAERR